MRLRLSAAIGAVAVLVGLLVSFQQGLAGPFPDRWAFVILVAGIAGVQLLGEISARRRTPLREAETGDPERRYEAPTPGDDLVETLELARRRSRGRNDPRLRLRGRLTDAAVAAVVAAEGCSESEARERIRTGEWTDDPVAAWFLSDDVSLTPSERARLIASAPFSRFEAAFGRTVRAIERQDDRGGVR